MRNKSSHFTLLFYGTLLIVILLYIFSPYSLKEIQAIGIYKEFIDINNIGNYNIAFVISILLIIINICLRIWKFVPASKEYLHKFLSNKFKFNARNTIILELAIVILIQFVIAYTVFGAVGVWYVLSFNHFGIIGILLLIIYSVLIGLAPGFYGAFPVALYLFYFQNPIILFFLIPSQVGDILDSLRPKHTSPEVLKSELQKPSQFLETRAFKIGGNLKLGDIRIDFPNFTKDRFGKIDRIDLTGFDFISKECLHPLYGFKSLQYLSINKIKDAKIDLSSYMNINEFTIDNFNDIESFGHQEKPFHLKVNYAEFSATSPKSSGVRILGIKQSATGLEFLKDLFPNLEDLRLPQAVFDKYSDYLKSYKINLL